MSFIRSSRSLVLLIEIMTLLNGLFSLSSRPKSAFYYNYGCVFFFFFQAEDGIRDADVTGVQTCALPISLRALYNFSRTAPATPRLVSLNRARRGAYNDIESVNISGGLVMLQLS